MRQVIDHLQEQKSALESKIAKIDKKIKFLLEEPRSEVAGQLNQTYEEKYSMLTKIEDLEDQLKKLLSKKYIEQLSTYNVKVDGKKKRLYIVEDEMVNPIQGFISSRSLLASMLINKKVGDNFVLKTPKGEKEYTVMS